MPEYFVYVDLNGAGDELDRLARGPDARTIASMEAALLLGYTLAEAKVHIITGHLAMSGHPMSAFEGASGSSSRPRLAQATASSARPWQRSQTAKFT